MRRLQVQSEPFPHLAVKPIHAVLKNAGYRVLPSTPKHFGSLHVRHVQAWCMQKEGEVHVSESALEAAKPSLVAAMSTLVGKAPHGSHDWQPAPPPPPPEGDPPASLLQPEPDKSS